jgi:hypothetical protein
MEDSACCTRAHMTSFISCLIPTRRSMQQQWFHFEEALARLRELVWKEFAYAGCGAEDGEVVIRNNLQGRVLGCAAP